MAVERPFVSIVIPAYNAARFLPRVVQAAIDAAEGAPVIVVDAGSTDGGGDVAEALGARVVRLQERAGPARARNIGVEHAESDVVLFIDSDCVPHPDAVKRVHQAFRGDPDLVSLMGSYDDAPPDPGFFSGYMNLRHHYIHSTAPRERVGFWAGCGAVRRDAFLRAGAFDAERYDTPQIEDIELGTRLARLGATKLDPDLRVTHLKRWTLRSVVETDVFSRAIPWSRLILERGEIPAALNTRPSQRLAAALAPVVLACLLAAPAILLLRGPGALAVAGVPVLISVGLHLPMLRCFARSRGIPFAVGAWLFHQIHLCYSAGVFALCWVASKR
jgi:GT2 family glycosyltransferase